jgi:hypothetical protein
LRNQSPIAHPFHIHNTHFYILSVNGSAPSPQLQGKKDVVLVPAGNSVVRFIAEFRDFYSDSFPYMYHCHMLSHEDDGMMGQFLVRKTCAAALSGPVDQHAVPGDDVRFSVFMNDTTGVTYQWQINTVSGFQDLSEGGQYGGVQNDTLQILNVNAANNGQLYRCRVTHPCRSFISSSALLQVNSGPDPSAEVILIYPDPAYDMIRFNDNTLMQAPYRMVLFDAIGRQLAVYARTAGQRTLSVKHLLPGTYFIWLTGSGRKQTLRFIKQ